MRKAASDSRRPDVSSSSNKNKAVEPVASELEALFQEHNEALLRLLIARLGSLDDAKEVAQEAYARLLQLGQKRVVSYERALLFRIAQNAATDRLRRKSNSQPHYSLELFERSDPTADPERSAGALQRHEVLQRIIKELPPKCWKAFIAVRYRGRTFAEVAEELGVGERMVRLYVSRALAYCRTRLEEELGQAAFEGDITR